MKKGNYKFGCYLFFAYICIVKLKQTIMKKVKPFITQNFFTDGSHGWLKVTKSRLEALNIADKITGCSFMRGDYAYLEEDCDLSTYVKAILVQENVDKDSDEYTVFMREFWNRTTTHDSSCSDRSCKIRSYSGYVYYGEAESQEKKELLTLLLGHRHWNKTGIRRINNGSLEDLRYWKEYYKL